MFANIIAYLNEYCLKILHVLSTENYTVQNIP